MKKYVFKDHGYLKYNYNYGEEDHQVEIWRCIKGDILYNSSNQEQCYIAALYKEGVFDVKGNGCLIDEDIYGWPLDQLKQLCEDNGIEVVFVNEEDLNMTDPLFIPKGLMCCVCEHSHRKCNHLDFTKMPVIQKHKDGYKEVKCLDFKRSEVND